MKYKRILLKIFSTLLFTLFTLIAEAQLHAQPLEVVRVLPAGENVSQVDSLTVTFNQPMAALGEFEKTAQIPLEIAPKLNCEWRWVNTTTLSCQLSEARPLQKATDYRVVVKKAIKSLKGEMLAQDFVHQFKTETAQLSYHDFKRWMSPSLPVISVSFNLNVYAWSVAASLNFVANGKPMPVRVLPQSSLDVSFYGDAEVGKLRDEIAKTASAKEIGLRWLIVPARELPPDAEVALVIKPGLKTSDGPLLGVEQKEIVHFRTFGVFKNLGFDCEAGTSTRSGDPSPLRLCDPMNQWYLRLTSPVDVASLKASCRLGSQSGKISETAKISGGAIGSAAVEAIGSSSPGASDYLDSLESWNNYHYLPKSEEPFRLGMPAVAVARKEFTLHCSDQLKDIFGRPIEKEFTINFMTGSRTPNLVQAYNVGVLEKAIDSEIPIYVTNLDEINLTYQARLAGSMKSQQRTLVELQKVQDLAYAVPLGVRKILGGASGAVHTELTAPGLSASTSFKGFYQVTPFFVHFKEGHFNSLVWVKDLATGRPVAGAEISLLETSYAGIASAKVKKIFGVTNKQGVLNLPGYVSYNPEIHRNYDGFEKTNFALQVKKDKDLALVFSNSDFNVYPSWSSNGDEYSYNYVDLQKAYGHVKVWGTSPQGVYRAGESIDFKIYVRNQDVMRFIPAPRKDYTLTVKDPMGKIVYKQKKIKLNDFGAFSGSFQTAKNAAVGWYQFEVGASFFPKRSFSEGMNEGEGEGEGEGDGEAEGGGAVNGATADSGEGSGNGVAADENQERGERRMTSHRVLVTDFTPAPFRAENDLDRAVYQQGDRLTVNTRARLHAGGPYGTTKTRINVSLEASSFVPQKNPLASQFEFQCGGRSSFYGMTVFEREGQLNAQGEQIDSVPLDQQDVLCGRLQVISDIADDRGKYFSAAKTAKFFAIDRLVGLRSESTIISAGEPATVQFLVVDINSNTLKDVPVELELKRQVVKKARVKGSGNAYLEEVSTSWESVSTCQKKSTVTGERCEFRPAVAGVYSITAKVKDSKGKQNINTEYLYVTGKNAVVWDSGENNFLRIIAESQNPKVGEKARYLVQNPYPGSDALVTIERYGVMKSWVQKFEQATAVVEVPITEDLLPGFHLSVTVFSPRVAAPLGEGLVDLGKPAFKLGYLKVVPDNPVKELSVKVATDAADYRPGANVTVNIEATTRSDKKMEKVEYAVAVLDEAVFDLIQGGSDYFNVFKGFYNLDPLDVNNYNLLMLLVGRQKFEKKGANAGGDGGGFAMRSLFKYVAYWNPSVIADKSAKAQLTFSVPDNLTGWRILVMAVTPSDRMGLGEGHFKVNRPTEVRPVMPNIVREGDRFRGAFSVMNRADKARDIQVRVSAAGDLVPDPKSAPNKVTPLAEKSLHLEPFVRALVEFDVKTNLLKELREQPSGKIDFSVVAGDTLDKDGMSFSLPVLKKRGLVTEADYGTTTENSTTVVVNFPKDMYADVGQMSAILSASVIGNVEGAFRYMRDYPYSCWEQRLTKGVMANSYLKLKDYVDSQLKWPEAPQVVQSLMNDAASFQAPNGGMVYYKATDDLVSPYLSAYTALAFQWLKERGEKIPLAVEEKLHRYLLTMLRTDVAPSFYTQGMSSTVRAVALAALAKAGAIKSQDVERFRSHMKAMDLFGKAHFLQAALHFPDGEASAQEALKLILGTANETGGKFRFSETLNFGWSRLHSSENRTQCAILSAMAMASSRPWGQKLLGDVPFKMVRALTQAKQKGLYRWQNTQENMFCAEALIDYARRYETEKPDMKLSVALAGAPTVSGELKDFRQKPFEAKRAIETQDLGKKSEVTIQRAGPGRLYYAVQLNYAPKEDFARSRIAGLEIRREYMVERNGKFVLLSSPVQLKKGELVKVNLFIEVPSARSFVVVNDPLPGALEVINTALATSSKRDSEKIDALDKTSFYWTYSDWNYFSYGSDGFYHQEVRHDSVQFYSEYLEKGRYRLTYMAQVIAAGDFVAMPGHAEEMYEPDVFGKTPAAKFEVQ